MKVCPKCGQSFNDDNLRYCLLDGEPLADRTSEPTIAMPTEASVVTAVSPRRKGKRSPVIWIAAGVVILSIGTVLLVLAVIFSYRMGREAAIVERNQNANVAAAPRTTPRTTTPTPSNASPEATPSASTPANSETDSASDEITPIAWTTAASGFKQDAGLTYKFHCPEKGTAATIWGSDVYTADSSICTAAVHAGVITLENGGDVTIEFKPGRSIYGSTTRNGIASSTYGEYPHSFVVR
jgi:hypothetical protein